VGTGANAAAAIARRRYTQGNPKQHVGFRASGLGFRASGSGFRASGSGFRASGSRFRASGSRSRASGSRFRVDNLIIGSGVDLLVIGSGVLYKGYPAAAFSLATGSRPKVFETQLQGVGFVVKSISSSSYSFSL
jgi:hypothetical protein